MEAIPRWNRAPASSREGGHETTTCDMVPYPGQGAPGSGQGASGWKEGVPGDCHSQCCTCLLVLWAP